MTERIKRLWTWWLYDTCHAIDRVEAGIILSITLLCIGIGGMIAAMIILGLAALVANGLWWLALAFTFILWGCGIGIKVACTKPTHDRQDTRR